MQPAGRKCLASWISEIKLMYVSCILLEDTDGDRLWWLLVHTGDVVEAYHLRLS